MAVKMVEEAEKKGLSNPEVLLLKGPREIQGWG